jgi:glycosyltransferase involved in cell wall biosynthesis
MSCRPRVALCLEYPLGLRGGVSVIAEELILGLGDEFDFILASPDDPAELASHPAGARLSAHVHVSLDERERDKLPAQLGAAGAQVVHFHAGGAYGWGNCWPVASLPEQCAKAGMKTLWTDHLVIDTFDGYVAGSRPMLARLRNFPFVLSGKRRQMEAVDLEIAVSDHDRRVLAKRYFKSQAGLRRIYHSRLDEAEEPATVPRRNEILQVGHIAFRKGQHVLAAAFAGVASQFSDWKLILAGHDSGDGCWQAIQKIVADEGLKDRVEMLGAVSDVAPLQYSASIYVQPSLHEALGLAVQEAVFRGCPAIGTRAGGIPEVIEEGVTGYLVSPDDAPAMAEALCKLIHDPGLRASFGKAGKASIVRKKMTRQGMLDAHRSLYRELLDAR